MASESLLLQHVLRRYTLTDAFDRMSGAMARPDLSTFLTVLFDRRARGVTAADVQQQMHADRFVAPSSVRQRTLTAFDQAAFSLLPDWSDIELSPLTPLGTCSALGPVDQKWIIGTTRLQEVVSDCTNVLALCASDRRRQLIRRGDRHSAVRLCTSHRLTRTQPLEDPRHTAHFRVFTLASAGRDRGSHQFELEALAEHLSFYVGLVAQLQPELSGRLRIRILDYTSTGVPWKESLQEMAGDNELIVEERAVEGWSYYTPLQFKIGVPVEDAYIEMIDGGFVDWTQTLLSDAKERMLISAIGSEVWCKCFAVP